LRNLMKEVAQPGFSLDALDGIEVVEFLVDVEVEHPAALLQFGCLRFCKPAVLLRLARGDGFSESFGLGLLGIREFL
jgi:hypothetical protein